MKTTVEIPDDLFVKAKTIAASRGISFKEVLVHSLASELDRIIDIGISQKEQSFPKRKEKRPLQVEFVKVKNAPFPKPNFVKKFDFDPVEILLEDRDKQGDFLLS